MEFSKFLFAFFALFAVLAGLDLIFGDRLHLGREFSKGISLMGPLALTMTGMIVLAPVLAELLSPVILPLYQSLGVDPSMFAGTLLACDMGGASLADQLTQDPQAAALSGIICASLLGVTVTFTIPVAMGVIQEADRSLAAKGILCGIVTIPLGILAGGLTARMPLRMVAINLLPTLPMTAIITIGLWKFERILIRCFSVFGKLMIALSTIGLMIGLLQKLTDWKIVSNAAPIEDAFLIVGEISILLSGAFPLMKLITRMLKKPLDQLGKTMGINTHSVNGLLTSTVNSIATFDTIAEMDSRGKILNMAFAVSAAFVFGDHLAFTGSWNPKMIPALIVAKLTAGLAALGVALLITKKTKEQEKSPHV